MHRRSLLAGLCASLLATPLTAAGATLPASEAMGLLDRATGRLRKRPSRLAPQLSARGLPPDFMLRQLAAIAVVDSFQQAAAEDREDPRWLPRLEEAGVVLAKGGAALVQLLEELPAAARERLSHGMRRPGSLARLVDGMITDPDQGGGKDRQDLLRQGLAGLAASVRHRSPSRLVDDLIKNFDLAASRLQLQRQGHRLRPAGDSDSFLEHRALLGLGMVGAAPLSYMAGHYSGAPVASQALWPTPLPLFDFSLCSFGSVLFMAGTLSLIVDALTQLRGQAGERPLAPRERELLELARTLSLTTAAHPG